MTGETVDAFLQENSDYVRSSKDGKSYLIQNVSSSCRSLKHKTFMIDVIDGIEYVGPTIIQMFEGFGLGCPATPDWQKPTGKECGPGCVLVDGNKCKTAGPGPGPTPAGGVPTPPTPAPGPGGVPK